MSRSGSERLFPTKKSAQHLIAEVPRRQGKIEMTIDIDLGDVWSHYCTLNEEGVVVDRRPRPLQDEFERSREVVYEYAPARVAMEAGTHSIWISEQLQELVIKSS
jgi:hypothetical protein